VAWSRRRNGRSKVERIIIKWAQPSADLGSTKRELVRGASKGNRENTVALAKVYSCFSRARGTKQYISFFLLIIGY
jgi:hypothetical protein